MAWGPGVAAGRNLYALNPSFDSPGDSRANYRGKQPIRNADIANVVTDALDLPRVPGAEFVTLAPSTCFADAITSATSGDGGEPIGANGVDIP